MNAVRTLAAILDGTTPEDTIASFLIDLHTRGETPEELAGFLKALRERAVPLPVNTAAFDICGTGGDGAGTFNISTTTAFVLAGGGVPIAKHGNRSASGSCGSADVLEALGVPLDLDPLTAASAIARDGFAFLYAPLYHPALARLAPVRRALKIRTVFNILGPLANPARVRRQIVGVCDRVLLSSFAKLLRDTGSEEVLVVAAEDGIDELSLSGLTHFAHLRGGRIRYGTLTPQSFGLSNAPLSSLQGGDVRENARVLVGILDGTDLGPRRAVVEMNAATGFFIAGKTDSLIGGITLARQTLDSGAALAVLSRARRPL